MNTLFRLFVLPIIIFCPHFSKLNATITSPSPTLILQGFIASGKIIDPEGNPLPGVNVIEKGSDKGAITDFDGKFSFNVSNRESILLISYLGFKSLELKASEGMNIQMEADVEVLQDVVLVGYGTSQKKDATGSIATISTEKFNQGVIVSPEQALVGKLSGVQITPGGGTPGSSSSIRIRGGSSLSASNDPLFVVDGLPLDNGVTIAGSSSPLNFINPNDIETITVLKDASSTAIYGARASNGVVLITTKSGTKEKGPWRFDFSSKTALASKIKNVDVLSTDQYREVVNQTGSDVAKGLLGNSNTNWQNLIFRDALTYDNNLSATGRILGTPIRLSVGYLYNNGILLTDNLGKLTASIKANRTFFDDHLSVAISLLGSKQDSFFADNGAIFSAVSMDPTQPVYTDSSDYGGYFEWATANGPINLATKNPLALLKLRNNKATNYRSIGNIKIDYKLHFLKDLKISANVGYDYSGSDGLEQRPAYAAVDFYRDGKHATYWQQRLNSSVDLYANYSKTFDFLINRVEVTGGYSYQKFRYANHNKDQSYDLAKTITDLRDSDERVLIGFFGRGNLNFFKDKYLLTASLRYDASSRFAPRNRWGLFPSVALAWRLKEESFLKSFEPLNNLKLRLSYGVTGQENIGSSYPYLSTFTISNSYAQYPIGNQYFGVIRPNAYDANITWEEQTSYNIGLDYGFFNDRINGSIDVYRKSTDRLLVQNAPIPLGSNLNNQITTNVGTLENYGVEFLISGKAIDRDKISLDIAYNITYNQNEITKLTLIEDPNFIGIQTGAISGGTSNTVAIHKVGYPANTFYLYQQIYDRQGKPIEGLFADLNGDGTINESDRRPYRPSQANLYMGLNFNFRYKNWDLSLSSRASFNNFVYNNIRSSLGNFSAITGSVTNQYLVNLSSDFLYSRFTSQDSKRFFSDYYLENGSFFKVDYISLGYSFSSLFKKTDPLRLSLTVQNPFIITRYTGIDPEISGGIDNNFYPRPRTFLFGINYSF